MPTEENVVVAGTIVANFPDGFGGISLLIREGEMNKSGIRGWRQIQILAVT